MSIAVKLLILLGVFAAGSAAGIRWHAGQDARSEVARLNTQAESVRLANANKTRQDGKVIEAQNAQTQRTRTLQAAAGAARLESDGLRGDLAAARASLPSAATDAGADNCSAERELLDVLGGGVEDLASKGAGIAVEAGGHASDSLTYQTGWPR